MTTFGWDDSHYGEPPRTRDGIDLYTHKLTDGDHYYEDAEYKASMDSARVLGIPILGPYHVLHGRRSIERQALWFVERATKLTPWWQSWPDWTWQIDAESFSYLTTPTIDEVNAFGDEISRLTGTPLTSILGYCPAWVYGDQLTRLRLPWWQSNYGSNPAVPYRQAYPGDASPRWNGPIRALMLQYGSRTIIANQPTSDANAYRGTLEQLKTALKGIGMALSKADLVAIWEHPISSPPDNHNITMPASAWLKQGYDAVKALQAQEAKLDELEAKINAGLVTLEQVQNALERIEAILSTGAAPGGDYILTGTVRMHPAAGQ